MNGQGIDFAATRWIPPDDLISTYRISEFLRATDIADMTTLFAKATAEPEWFYPAAHEFLGMSWPRPWTMVRDVSDGEPYARWFGGGGTNLSWLACERWTDATHPAIIAEREDGETTSVSFRELAKRVQRAADGLRSLGVGAGDVVAMYLPPIEEAIVTMLAVARIGAIVAPAFSGYGTAALAERLRLSGAKVLITADGTVRRGRHIEMAPVALAAADLSGTVDRVVMVARLGRPGRADRRVMGWTELLSGSDDGPFEVLDGQTPWLLAFTSGSTGRPKGAVHTHGGMGYQLGVDLGLSLDVGPGDRLLWPADMGWLAGPMLGLGPLVLGATTVLFDGVVDANGPDAVWRLIERHQVTHYGLPPTMIRLLASRGEQLVRPFALESLRILATSGEPLTAPAWKWLHCHIGRGRRPIINFTGGTEVGGMFLTCYANVATEACHFSGPNLGVAVDVVDGAGRSLVDEFGELVVRRSWPSMTQGLWGEPQRYLESYWSQIPGTWVHGDRAIRHADGSFEVPGRSDDVLKVAGKRVGPAEYESIAMEVDGVLSAAAIGYPHPTVGEVAVVVISVDINHVADEQLPRRVADHIETAFGRAMRPAAVIVVEEFPVSGSGKIHRRAVRGWLTGQDPGDLSTIVNAEVEDQLVQARDLLTEVLGIRVDQTLP